jgi:hypothetical protein
MSNVPLSGKYYIACYEVGETDPAKGKLTSAIDYNMNQWHVYAKIWETCPTLRNKFQVIPANDPHVYYEDGVNWWLFFENVNQNLPQF